MKLFKKPLSSLFGAQEVQASNHAPHPSAMEYTRPPKPATGGGCGSGSCGCGAGEAPPQESLNQVWSEKPNVLRLQAGRQFVHPGDERSYTSPSAAAESPLAMALLDIPGVDAVSFKGSFVSITVDDSGDTRPPMAQAHLVVQKFLNAGGEAVRAAPSTARKYNFGFRQVSSRPKEEQMRIVEDLFENEVNPAVAAHGGFFRLLDVKDDTVYVQLGGGCQGCGMANVTLRQGVENRLREVLPEMVALVDVTDHASGTNPYFQAGKK